MLLLATPARIHAAPPPKTEVKVVADFSLKDNRGKIVSLRQFKDQKAIVLIFTGTQCPIGNNFLPYLADLHKEFGSKGVQLLGINSNSQDSFQEMVEHAEKFKIPFPMLKDDRNIIADRINALRTPEIFVLDAERRIRYTGRINDRFEHDTTRPAPTRDDLRAALGEILAGKEVSVPRTTVAGCFIGRVEKTKKEGPVTFTKHISRLMQKHCQECHRPGQVAPMPLLTYDDVVSWSRMIHKVVRDKRMPPWYAHPDFGKFANDRTLPEADFNQLLAWIEDGMPRGKEEDLPPAKEFPKDWIIGKPDTIIQMPVEFEVPAETPKGGIPYKHYVVQTDFEEDKWVIRAEAKAGAPEVVHHILVFIVPPGKTFIPGTPEIPVLTGMAPGEQAFIHDGKAAKFIPKGAKLVFQVHYTPNGKAYKDRSCIGLVFGKRPEKIISTQPIFNIFFRIPPGADNYEVETTHTFDRDGYIVGIMPHMHLRGKDFIIKAIYPDKKEETLLFVPKFNFYWQGVYRPAEPLKMPKGTKLHCVAHYDNSKGNPHNPDPTKAISWGDQTWQEMMIAWFDFAYDLPPVIEKKEASR